MSSKHGAICKVKIGLLFLRDCGNEVSGQCAACGRPVCTKHISEAEKGPVCPECAIDNDWPDVTDSLKMVTKRRKYNLKYKYRPFYKSKGGGGSQVYSDWDYRIFEERDIFPDEEFSGKSDNAHDDYDDYMES